MLDPSGGELEAPEVSNLPCLTLVDRAPIDAHSRLQDRFSERETLWNRASQAEKRQVDALSHSRNAIIILLVLAITFVTVENLTVHAILSYTLTLSSSRIQEANNPGVVMTLNVSGTTSGAIYGLAWNVTDPY